jgi:hypothetical protein
VNETNFFSPADRLVDDWAFGLEPISASRERSAQLDEEVDAIVLATPRALRTHARSAAPLLLTAARGGGITHLRRIAYLLATALHGSQFGAQLIEPGTDEVLARYDPETDAGSALGNVHPGDGARFRGRGFVYVRGRAAYAAWSKRLGMPDVIVNGTVTPFFVAHPAALARPQVAAQTIVRGMRDGIFTGVALGTYVNDKKTDFHNARRTIDGSRHAREVAAYAEMFSHAIESVHAARHDARMQAAALRLRPPGTRDLIGEINEAVERLAARGEVMPIPVSVVDWNGEARQGKFVQLDERTCALHMGRGMYIQLDVQRDLNGVTPPEGRNMSLKRSGDVQPAVRHGNATFWR